MKVLVTGSSGHLGEALVRTLRSAGEEVVGLDIKPSAFTTVVGSVTDRSCVQQCLTAVHTVFHTATLHKPHVATHSKQNFVDTNISGTLVLLEEATSASVRAFVFTSTTSVYGSASRPAPGADAAWITEEVEPSPRNIYGITKHTAEQLCLLAYRRDALACIVLRTSRFFPEEDDDHYRRTNFDDRNAKANEMLFRRVELLDVVNAHIRAAQCAPELGFGRFIVSATTPFLPEDLQTLNLDAAKVLHLRIPDYLDVYEQLGWRMFERVDRVYVNQAARDKLGWVPEYDFELILARLRANESFSSSLTETIGKKGYHDTEFEDGPYPVEE